MGDITRKRLEADTDLASLDLRCVSLVLWVDDDMGIEVRLKGETGEVLAEVGDPQMVLSRATQRAFAGTRLLKYLVPWGDAMFNQAQAGDLQADLSDLKEANLRTPLFDLLSEIEPLVAALSRETHVYLWFIGD